MEKSDPNVAPSRGLINQKISMEKFDLIRILPSDGLKLFLENYWIIEWDLSGQPDYVQENLPHPSVNLVIDPYGQSGVFGVQTGRFSYCLSGSGRLFGAKFRPGAFHSFYGKPVSESTDKNVRMADVFGVDDKELETQLQQANAHTGFIGTIETLLLNREPHLDEKAILARKLVESIAENCALLRVDELARISGISERGLQRLFDEYVGVSPKWVIDRYRMLSAVDEINRGKDVNLTDLAHRLGYFDSAHFSRCFKTLTGVSPSALLTQS